MRRPRRASEGMTLIEIMVVTAIMALGMTGMAFSLGALAKTNLKAGATRFASAARFAYNRAVVQGSTVRLSFDMPAGKFSIEEAHGKVTLARADDVRQENVEEEGGQAVAAVDPWAAAKQRIDQALKPTLGSSPFGPLTNDEGETIKRYQDIALPRHVQLVKLSVPHEPEPRTQGKGAVHFFPGGYSEHAVLLFSDGADAFMSVELHPLTGHCTIHEGEFEPREFLDDPGNRDATEIEE
jgi:type II secretion system protein H